MTLTARRMAMGARMITTGKQLIGQLHGAACHVGPNALLRSASYPAVTASPGSGPLLNVPTNTNFTWRVNNNDEFQTAGAPDNDPNGGLAYNWTGYTGGTPPAYVYNNHPANYGGVVASDMMIDGWPVVAGTEVFQFMDLSAGGLYLDDGGSGPPPGVLFRGCRFRAYQGPASIGFIQVTNAYTTPLYVFYCDLGGTGIDIDTEYASVSLHFPTAALTVYRNYFSLHGTALQPLGLPDTSGEGCDVVENFMEKWVYNPEGEGDHDNGISAPGGGWSCLRWQRNYILIEAVDANGRTLDQTDCLSLGSDGGASNIGTGTNPDGTPGFQITNNYCGGGGSPYYLGYNGSNTVSHLNFAGNLVTTAAWSTGGFNGPTDYVPAWGSNSNTQSNNLWADGPDAGTSFM